MYYHKLQKKDKYSLLLSWPIISICYFLASTLVQYFSVCLTPLKQIGSYKKCIFCHWGINNISLPCTSCGSLTLGGKILAAHRPLRTNTQYTWFRYSRLYCRPLFYLLSFSEDVLTIAPADGGSWVSWSLTSQSYLLLHLWSALVYDVCNLRFDCKTKKSQSH